MDIKNTSFPAATEGDRVLWTDNKWYVYTNGTWVLETN